MVSSLPTADLIATTPRDREALRAQYDPWTWARETARVQLPKSGPIDLASHPFLRDVFRDTYPEIVVIKGAQLGFSTTAMVRTFWFVTTFPVTAMYTFPTSSDVTKFTQSRINPLITGTPHLKVRIVDVNSVSLKQFIVGSDAEVAAYRRAAPSRRPQLIRSTVYFSGAATEKDAATVDADLVVHDEEDLANPQVIEQFESRLDASRFKWRFRLSTPRIPGAGIDRPWKQSDQRKWLITCSRCNAEFEMGFPGGPWDYSCIVPETYEEYERTRVAHYVCPRCRMPLREEDRSHGRWEATNPGWDRPHGYQVSQMAAPWVPAERILYRKYRATWESDFWNLVMGIPWEEGTNAMTRAAILSRCSDAPMAENGSGCTMGVDVGAKMDVVIGSGLRTLHFGRYDSFDDLDRLMERFGVVTCVIDAAPEEHLTRAWADKYNEYGSGKTFGPRIRVWRQTYGTVSGMREVGWNETTGVVTAPRTEILGRSAEELLSKRVLPRYDGSPAWEAYLAHHGNSKKVPKFVEGLEREQVLERWEWHEVGPDHLFHAGTYEMLARMAPRGAAPPLQGLVTLKRSSLSTRVERPAPPVRPRGGLPGKG